MSEIIERLRKYRPRDEFGDPVQHTICDEAADEIAKQRALIETLVKALEFARGAVNENEFFADVAVELDAAISAAKEQSA